MATFKTTQCPNCGAGLQVPHDKDDIICMYCGGQVVVKQTVPKIAGSNVDNLLKLAEVDREAGQLGDAIHYYNKVLEVEVENATAWFGKGKCLVLRSIGKSEWQNPLDQAVTFFKKAVEYAEDQAKMKKRIAFELWDIVTVLRRGIMIRYRRDRSNSLTTLMTKVQMYELDKHMAMAFEYHPDERIIKEALNICQEYVKELTGSLSTKHLTPEDKHMKAQLQKYTADLAAAPAAAQPESTATAAAFPSTTEQQQPAIGMGQRIFSVGFLGALIAAVIWTVLVWK